MSTFLRPTMQMQQISLETDRCGQTSESRHNAGRNAMNYTVFSLAQFAYIALLSCGL